MTLQEHKEYITIMTDQDLLDQYNLYVELQSTSTSDQLFLNLLEQEVVNRGLESESV